MSFGTGVVMGNGPQDWHMLTYVAEQVGSVVNNYLYMDGILVGSNSTVENLSTTDYDISLYIGAYNWGGPTSPANGLLDNMAIFNKALNQTDIEFLYNSGNGTEELSNIMPTDEDISVDGIDYNSNGLIFEDTIGGFTGNGYMIANDFSNTHYRTLNYPIRAINPDTYDLWMRVINTSTAALEMDILLDGIVFDTISTYIDNPTDGLEWTWINTTLVLPDNRDHTLGIRLKENNTAIDKIYIEKSSDAPYTEGPDHTTAPYFTTHLRVYSAIYDDPSALTGIQPNTPLLIYDYKNSITEIIQDDWYNFDIRILDSSGGYQSVLNWDGNYFLVMATSGSNTSNFATWELIDNEEQINPSADSIIPVSAIKF